LLGRSPTAVGGLLFVAVNGLYGGNGYLIRLYSFSRLCGLF